MNSFLNYQLSSVLLVFCVLPFNSFAAEAAKSTVGVKCEITRMSHQREENQRFVRTMDLKVQGSIGGVDYKFDHIETLKIPGKTDLKVWVEGRYFHNDNEVNSFLRFDTTVCENKPGTAEVKCFGRAFSGDIFAEVVKAKTIWHGKKLQMFQTGVPGTDFSKNYETEMKYRLITGRNLLDDLDTNDPVQREKYIALVSPVVGARCSVRDDAFGVVSAF